MANFVYSFDTGLYDISNHSDEGYPWKSGPTPIKNTLGFTHNETGEYFASAGQFAHSGSVYSPLSDGNNGVNFLTGGRLGSNFTGSAAAADQQIVGLLYNYIPAASAAELHYHLLELPTEYSSGWHTPVMRFSAEYHGKKMALVTSDNLTILYTITYKAAASSTVIAPTLSGYNLAVGPNLRRKVALGYA
jgi:hypothetical protein